MSAARTFAATLSAELSLITQERLANNTRTSRRQRSVASARLSLHKHHHLLNQHLKRFAEVLTASKRWANLAIRYFLASMLAVVLEERPNVFHA